MRSVRGWLLPGGCGAVATGAVLLLWPFRRSGLAGNAIRPRYTDFGWVSNEPLPEHPTRADFRRAGIRMPQDVLGRRRLLAGAVTAAGLAALVSRSVWH
jgi:hypothetical protein